MSDPVIGLDARMWRHPGIGRYLRELLSSMSTQVGPGRIRTLSYAFDEESLRRVGTLPVVVKSPIYSVAEQIEIPRAAKEFDVLHVPHYNAPLLYRGTLVLTVHDLIHFKEELSSRSPLRLAAARFLLNKACHKASAIITVSQATRNDLLGFFRNLRGCVTVVPEAASSSFRQPLPSEVEAVRAKFNLKRPFVLFVGTLKPHKNLVRLIEAFDQLHKKGLSHELVVVGMSDPKWTEPEEMGRTRSFVRFLGRLDDADLPALYGTADLFVLPSLREGFGLPILEAMACGTPVAVSNQSSLPEVAGEAGVVFDPLRVDPMAEVLYNTLQNQSLREDLSRKGLERSKRFLWSNAATLTLETYRNALESGRRHR